MNLTVQLTSYFKFANKNNFSITIPDGQGVSGGDENGQSVTKVYARCVNCNIKRFKNESEMQNVELGGDCFFCMECSQKLLKQFQKYFNPVLHEASPEEIAEFSRIYSDLIQK